MNPVVDFEPIRLPKEFDDFRTEVREFLAAEVANGTWNPKVKKVSKDIDRSFAHRVAKMGWIGMCWPKEFGGGGRSFLERYILQEEYRIVSAPTSSYSTGDRQSGPVIMKYATEEVKRDIIPRIISGELTFCIGLSEPNSGSDLFAANVRAKKVDGGYLVNGTKIWTSNAHHAHYMIGLFRTAEKTKENHRHGLTQFLVDLSKDGIKINPIHNLAGFHEFNEVVFEDCFVEDKYLIGEENAAWKQATSELAFERSGPERFLETIYVLIELIRVLGENPDARAAEGVGRLVAQLHCLRRMSISVNGMLAKGLEPTLQGSIVKNMGTLWEQELPANARELAAFVDDDADGMETFEHLLEFATLIAPKVTIQGGATEILRGIIARGLGLR